MRTPPRRLDVLASSIAVALLSACATGTPPGERAGEPVRNSRLITAAEIAESGARNAWELIRRKAGLGMTEDAAGDPTGLRMRGPSSFLLDDAPVVVVDGVRLQDLEMLRSLDVGTIERVEFTNGIQGTLRYGTGSGGGAIVITTRSR